MIQILIQLWKIDMINGIQHDQTRTDFWDQRHFVVFSFFFLHCLEDVGELVPVHGLITIIQEVLVSVDQITPRPGSQRLQRFGHFWDAKTTQQALGPDLTGDLPHGPQINHGGINVKRTTAKLEAEKQDMPFGPFRIILGTWKEPRKTKLQAWNLYMSHVYHQHQHPSAIESHRHGPRIGSSFTCSNRLVVSRSNCCTWPSGLAIDVGIDGFDMFLNGFEPCRRPKLASWHICGHFFVTLRVGSLPGRPILRSLQPLNLKGAAFLHVGTQGLEAQTY